MFASKTSSRRLQDVWKTNKYLLGGDLKLADRGFTIAEALAEAHGAILKIPHFTKRKSQMSGKEVDNSRKISG